MTELSRPGAGPTIAPAAEGSADEVPAAPVTEQPAPALTDDPVPPVQDDWWHDQGSGPTR